jgi:heme iron utilization protein
MSASSRPARMLLRSLRNGVLATQSVKAAGFPFASALPYAIDEIGRPIIFVSDLAAHTENIKANPNVSFVVHEADVVAGARVTLVGTAALVDDDAQAKERYLKILPEAEAFTSFGDFHFYRIEPRAVHYIGGFGNIQWFEREGYLVKHTGINERENEVVTHMNEDHRRALKEYCLRYHNAQVDEVTMINVDCDGFDVRANNETLRIAFPSPVTDAGQARAQFIEMTKVARQA